MLTLVVTAANPGTVSGSPDTWVQTTKDDFEAGVLNNVNTSFSPGNVKLAAKYCYALQGDGQVGFSRYDIAANSWDTMADTLVNVYYGGSLVYDGTDIYALQGNNQETFWRYDIAANSWIARADIPGPGNVSSGGSLTYDGTYIYALQGNYTTAFWRYNIATNLWDTRTPAPNAVGSGGALTYDGTYIYALRGNDQTTSDCVKTDMAADLST